MTGLKIIASDELLLRGFHSP